MTRTIKIDEQEQEEGKQQRIIDLSITVHIVMAGSVFR
jgi:hypothetical protein